MMLYFFVIIRIDIQTLIQPSLIVIDRSYCINNAAMDEIDLEMAILYKSIKFIGSEDIHSKGILTWHAIAIII